MERMEKKIKSRAMPITIAFIVAVVAYTIFHYAFLADDEEDQVVAPQTDEALRTE